MSHFPVMPAGNEQTIFASCIHACHFRQGEVRLAPRAVFLDAQRSFFSSKKEEEASKTAAEEEKPEVSEAEKALNERIAELEEKHAEVWLLFQSS